MKKINLDALSTKYGISDYKELYAKVIALIEDSRIKPVKASGINGKSPALYREYWIIEKKQDMSQYLNELNYEIVPAISTDYYRVHIDQYIQDRPWVLLLNAYIRDSDFMTCMSENERSFDIWRREKFLKQEQGKKILKRCGLDTKVLNFYRTTEPIAYYCATRRTPQKLLVIENKDTFYSMRKCLIDSQAPGSAPAQSKLTDGGVSPICGEQIGTLLYGAGKGIIAAFSDFDISGEPYMAAPENTVLYFGDLDYEGIGIYENFAAMYGKQYRISLFKAAYEKMLTKAERIGIDQLPVTKEGQNRKIENVFLSQFSQPQQDTIKEILENDRYIPQEILNISDMMVTVPVRT
ncbi:MAG: hypothetical protein K2N73_16605 [Lachnospiraceae bacterium]|nr:hypothetical protein [Lachnospiraceae bacterium]